MGTLFGLKAFAVAILGGLGSAWGVMLAGLLFGMRRVADHVDRSARRTRRSSLPLVIVALALMPNGLFGRAGVKKV